MSLPINFHTGPVKIYSVGLCYASACAPKHMSREDVEAAVNRQYPTGIASQWRIADEPFRTGGPNPGPCELDPDRRHYLLSC